MKDYYAILGATPDAEDVVIRAAYKALAQRYHPDRYPGSKEEAHLRMSELNAAYAVLSDPAKRREYDERRATADQETGTFGDAGTASAPGPDPQQVAWDLALKYQPRLRELEARLSKFSWKLASAFRSSLLETKNFQNARSFAEQLEFGFFKTYFGRNLLIVSHAKFLLTSDRRDAALELNNVVNVLGDGVNGQESEIIERIGRDFNVDPDPPHEPTYSPRPQANADIGSKFFGGGQHPWRRYFAKTFDMFVFGTVGIFLVFFSIALISPRSDEDLDKAFGNGLLTWGTAAVSWVLLESFALCVFGTTPARWAFGISVRSARGDKLTLGESFKRSLLVLTQGMWLGIPLISAFPIYWAYNRLTKTGTTLWDSSVTSVVTHTKWGWDRTFAFIITFVVVAVLIGMAGAI